MSKYVLNKLIEARRLNKRTGTPMPGHGQSIPYGSIIHDVTFDGDLVKFSYMAERYQFPAADVKGFLIPAGQPMRRDADEEAPKGSIPGFAPGAPVGSASISDDWRQASAAAPAAKRGPAP